MGRLHSQNQQTGLRRQGLCYRHCLRSRAGDACHSHPHQYHMRSLRCDLHHPAAQSDRGIRQLSPQQAHHERGYSLCLFRVQALPAKCRCRRTHHISYPNGRLQRSERSVHSSQALPVADPPSVQFQDQRFVSRWQNHRARATNSQFRLETLCILPH